MKRHLPCLLLACTFIIVHADDWPQWMGPNRDGVWLENGIVRSIPDGGLKVTWRAPVHYGYAGPAVAKGRVYVMEYEVQSGEVQNNPGGRAVLQGRERVRCLDAKTGELLWTQAYERPYQLSYPGGPRCTPAISDGKVYALGAEGNLTCLNAADGSVVWRKDLPREYKVPTQIWGHAAHPLVVGDLVYCLAGGEGTMVVALDKNTGEQKWGALSGQEPGYCPPNLIEHAGRRQLIVWTADTLNGLDPASGKEFWSIPLKPAYGLSSSMPRQVGDHLYASAIGNISALVKLEDGDPGASVVWRGRTKEAVYCSNSTPFVTEDTIYGADIESSALMAVNLADGQRLWETTAPTLGEGKSGRHGTVFLVRNGDLFFLFTETGHLILARLTRAGYEEVGRQKILEPTNEAFGRSVVWSHPAFAEKCMFARNDKEIVCVNLAAE